MINRVFDDDAVVLYTSCNDNYVLYLLVLLTSVICNSSENDHYDIIILEMSMSKDNIEKIEKLAVGHSNISIRVFNLYAELKFDIQFRNVGKWVPEMYASILGIYALDSYEKAVYMDCDVIFLKDVRELYQVDCGAHNLIGAVKLLPRHILKDLFHAVTVKNWRGDFDMRTDYFNNGIMIQNARAFREAYNLEYILNYIVDQNYELLDQDIMNLLTRKRVVWIDAAWNVYPYTKDQFDNIISMIPENERTYWVKGYENWACIHYTIPVKPWLEMRGSYSYAGRFFWKYAACLEKKDFSFLITQAFMYNQNKKFLADIIERNFLDFEKSLQGKKLLVYGYGFQGKRIYQSKKFNIAGFIDKDEKKKNAGLSIPVEGLELAEKSDECVVLISNDKWENIALELKENGIKNMFSLACLEKRDMVSWYPEKQDYYSVSSCFGMLGDEKSRRVFDSLISKRIQRVMDRTIKYSDIYENDQYFRRDLFTVTPEEIYVDVGSYNGCTIDGFQRHVKNQYKRIYGFELNKSNYKILCKNVSGENIILRNIAISDDRNEEGHYNKAGYYTNLAECGEETVQVDSLDNLMPEAPTFIKINVYNTKEVVCGGRKILLKHRPKLAIVLSNYYSDLWEIPLLVHNINSEYKLYIRHHSIDYSSTVLYAV